MPDDDRWVRRGKVAAYWMTTLLLLVGVTWMVLEMRERFG